MRNINDTKKIIGWGTTTAFENYYQEDLPHAYLIDSDVQKHGTVIQGMTVFAPEQLLLEDPEQVIIIIYSCFWSQISKQIAKLGPYKVIYCKAIPAFRSLLYGEEHTTHLAHKYAQFKKGILIPCHVPKIKYLEYFISSIKEPPDFKIIIMTTTHEEEQVFRKTFQGIKYVDFFSLSDCTSMLAPDLLQNLINFTHPIDILWKKTHPTIDREFPRITSLINIKKLVGLRKLFEDGYHYLMCMDCDVMAGSLPLNIAMERSFFNYQKRCYFGAPFERHWKLCEWTSVQSLSLFEKNDILALLKLTKNATVYSWFYEPPSYQYDDFNDFNDYMVRTHHGYENFVRAITGLSFDHILFSWFLILKNKATMLDYSEMGIGAIPEWLSFRELQKIKQHYDYVPVWATYGSFMILSENKKKQFLKTYPLIYHTDRSEYGLALDSKK